jgi:photosystem II stability/assembly factor-like uncharacterized protein
VRNRIIFPILATWLAVSLPGGRAPAATGVRGLDEAAIAVKAPSKVEMIAVTRAGNRLVAVGEHGVIIYSDDDGLNWTQASVPVNLLLTAVRFASASVGWAVGQDGVILRTDDGGATWRLQFDGIQANQLTLATAQAATASHDPSPGTPLALRRANFFVTDGPNVPFLSVLAIDPDHAFAFGAYRMVMKTDDGGKTWQDWSLHVGDPLSHNLYDVSKLGADICLAAEAGKVFCSADGGASFPAVASAGSATLFGILPAGDGAMLAFGVAGGCYRSTDAGQSWTSIDSGTSINLTAGTVLATGAIVLAGEDGSLYLSTDHGASFQRAPANQPMAIYGLAQASDGDLIAVGNLGVLRISLKNLSQS